MAGMTNRLVLVAILGLPIAIAAAVYGPAAFDLVMHRRPPERYLIPGGYTGWVRIDFRQANAPPLSTEGGHRVIKFGLDGTVRTSSGPAPGHGRDEFFSYSASGLVPLSNAGVCKGGTIWGVETMVDDRTSKPFTRFYVGSENQYRHEVDPGRKAPACE